MSLRRTGTKRAPHAGPGGPRTSKTTYQTVQQGFKELYNPQKENGPGSSIDVDIVFVPGLGAHPEDSWKSDTGFNWATGVHDGASKTTGESKKDSVVRDGLARDFPKARILLYQYESAWAGDIKVKSFMRDIAKSMLEGLQGKREGIRDRPIVLIGHSMGGLVIAKAVTLAAEPYRDIFPRMFECIAACAFFGTPFGGAKVAAVASMLSECGEKLGLAKSSALVKMMTPEDESLKELKCDFLRLVGKMSQPVQLFCFYENQPTDFTREKYGSVMSKVAKAVVPKSLADFVPRESAVLDGFEQMGLAADHRNLVKFADFKDSRYQLVREPLKRLIHGAGLVVKSRLSSIRGIDQETVNRVMELLNGGQVTRKRRILASQFSPSTWISKETEYLAWLEDSHEPEAGRKSHRGQALFIRGPEGRGKTRATMAALQDIDRQMQLDEKENHGRGRVFLAYFFCDPSSEFSTAEDLLKSLVRQLISQRPALAVYAKHFAKKREEPLKAQANLTVENLWQTLQDVLMDEFIGRRVYFIINNLHVLPEDAESTIKLMRFLNTEMQELASEDDKHVPTRWFLTSRDTQNAEDALKVEGIRLIDLENEKYCDQVQLELRKTAQEKVRKLGEDKHYNKALTYYASSLIGKRASNSQWINLSCMQLAELPEAESDLRIRQMLEEMPQELQALLDAAWAQILRANEKDADKIKELVRTLLITFEEPTEDELALLAGFPATEEGKAELKDLVQKCRPLLLVRRSGRSENTIGFMDMVVKDHLLDNMSPRKTLGMSADETRWQHGIIAHRCLAHIKEKFNYPPIERPAEQSGEESSETRSAFSYEGAQEADEDEDEDEDGTSDSQSEPPSSSSGGDGEEEEEDDADYYSDDDWEDDDSNYCRYMEDDEMEEAQGLIGSIMPYPVKHWLHHASKATLEIAEDLSDDDFWQKESLIRYRWLLVYMYTTNVLAGFEAKHLTALHIAAAVGFKQLVSALIQDGHDDEIDVRDELYNTPLHFAAYVGRPNIVDELLRRGASIDDGIEIGQQTPLHMAANAGHVKIMHKLIQKGANANAIADDIGPVMNAAISSGNPDAVRLLVDKDVSLAVEDDSVESPLALAGLHADLSMFEYLTETYADKLPPKEFDKAFVKAATSGRVDVFNKLLTYHHPEGCFQDALEAATDEENWDIAMILLGQRQNLDCNHLFLKAATTFEQQDGVLEAVWKYTNGSLTKETLNESLYRATDHEKESTVKLLLESFKVDPNATGQEYGTALTAAANDGTMNIVHLLLHHGAEINSPDGWALQAAAAEGHYDVVEELLDRGADVNSLTENENLPQGTALQAACESGKVQIVTLLIERGANPDLGAGEETCPIMAAAMRGEQTILELLVKARAEVNVFGGWANSTVMIHAVLNLPIESLQVLLDAGADINLENEDGDTPLIMAAREGDAKCVEFLLDHGADIFHINHDNENALQSAIMYGPDEECTSVLIERVSEIMSALRKAMQNGNTAVSNVIRSVGYRRQGLTYDDWEDHEGMESGAFDDGHRGAHQEDTPRTESFPNSARRIEPTISHPTPGLFKPRGEKMAHELEAAIAAQVSMLQQFGPPPTRPEKVLEKEPIEIPPTTIAELPSQRRYSQQVHLEEQLFRYEFDQKPSLDERPPQRPSFIKQPTVEWAQQAEGLANDPLPSPGQTPIRRKPAPFVAFGASYAQNPSPAPSSMSNSQYPPPSQYPNSSSDQRPGYHNSQSYPGAPVYQGGGACQPPPPPPQTFQTGPSAEYAVPPPFHAPYDPSSYRPSPGNTPPQQTQPFPDLPLQVPGGWQSPPQVSSPPQLPSQQQHAAFSPANGSPPQAQQQPHEWYNQETRPDMRNHRSSFMGMKNTIDKAKQFSTGIMNRKTSGF